MNQKTLLAAGVLIIVLLVAGGFLLVNRTENNNQAPSPQTPVQTVSSPTPAEETATPTPEATKQKEAMVTLSKNGFSPKTVTVKTGDKVFWKNESGETATVNSAPHPIHTTYPKLNLGNFEDGETLELIFTDPGTYNYHNHLNVSQTGSVIVE